MSGAERRPTWPDSPPTRSASAPHGRRQPVRRRRAVVRRRQRHPAADRPLLHRRLLAGARTGGHRNLLRGGARLGLLDHPALQRQRRRSQARGPGEGPTLRLGRGGSPAEGDHPRPRAGDDRGAKEVVPRAPARAAASKACPRSTSTEPRPTSCVLRWGRCSASSAPGCATCSRARSPPRSSKLSRVASSDSLGPQPVRARGLVKRYGEILAVDHIDLNVRSGDVYGFLGPTGPARPPPCGWPWA